MSLFEGTNVNLKGWIHGKKRKIILWKPKSHIRPYHTEHVVNNPKKYGMTEHDLLKIIAKGMDGFEPEDDETKDLLQDVKVGRFDRDDQIDEYMYSQGWVRVVLNKGTSSIEAPRAYNRNILPAAKVLAKRFAWEQIEFLEMGDILHDDVPQLISDEGSWKTYLKTGKVPKKTEIGSTMAMFREWTELDEGVRDIIMKLKRMPAVIKKIKSTAQFELKKAASTLLAIPAVSSLLSSSDKQQQAVTVVRSLRSMILGEEIDEVYRDSGLGKWFHGQSAGGKPGWDRYNTKGERIGKCGDAKKGEGKPKCLSRQKAAKLRAQGGKKAIANAVRRKRAKDPDTDRPGTGNKPINVSNRIDKDPKKKGIQDENNPRIPRKPGQPANSKKHSDLYTDENPKGTIHGLGFKDVETAKSSVAKIKRSDRSHAHKIQAAIAMEQRAREMGKTSEAAVYRKYINQMKKKTKEKNEGWSDKYKKSIDCDNPKGFSQRAHCDGRDKKEETMKSFNQYLQEKNKPTNPKLWAASIAAAKRKFDVYPSAYANAWASKHYKSKGGSWTKSESVEEGCGCNGTSEEAKSPAWQRKAGKNKEGGLNAAGRRSYERENPGSDLKAPVSAKTAKKNPDGKAAKRRKSFCARMGGMPGPMKDEKGRPTRKALALRKWDC